MGRGRVDVVESLTAAERTTGVDRTRWAGQGAASMPAAPALPVRHCIHDNRPLAPILYFHCP